MPSSIIGTGRAFPERVVTNAELARRFKVSEEEIVRKTGVQTRYWSDLKEKPSVLAVHAGRKALESACLSPNDLDLILVSTTTPDFYFPSTATLVQKGLLEMGVLPRPIPAFDINASCSGFLYALSVADQYLKNRSVDSILIVSTDVKSRFIDPNDLSTAILFGDGAGAVVISRGERGIRKIQIGADGSQHHLITLPGGGARRPITRETLEKGLHHMKMEGKGLFRVAVKKMESTLLSFLSESSLSFDDIDFYIFHQANLRILECLFKRIPVPLSKTEITLSKFGNTSSSTIPIALDVAIRSGKLKKGDRLILSSFGGGITWANVLIDW